MSFSFPPPFFIAPITFPISVFLKQQSAIIAIAAKLSVREQLIPELAVTEPLRYWLLRISQRVRLSFLCIFKQFSFYNR